MKKYVILLVVCVAVSCVILTLKDRLSKSEPTQSQTSHSATIGDSVLRFETQATYQDMPLPTTDYTTQNTTTEDPQTLGNSDQYFAMNFENPTGMWFTFMDYQSILLGKSEGEFRQSIEQRFQNAKDLGVDTLYVQVRSHGDSYYISEIFPKGKYYDSDFDPLEVMVEVAHSKGLSIHAWINPMRGMSTELMDEQSDSYVLKQWCQQYDGTYVSEYGGYWYLNPYYSEVRQLICDGIAEIVSNYCVDGIHIDDYFYPTTDESFDERAFADSNQSDLLEFRRGNVSTMVKQMYDTVKSLNPTVEFGISPQGNVDIDYYQQCADVQLWASTEGYCDYIVPQLYYGFENSTCPYASTVDLWSAMCEGSPVKLIVGVGTYKIGLEDTWAGSGSNEWIDGVDIVGSQIAYALDDPQVDGVAVYSYASTFEPTGESSLVDKVTSEREAIQSVLS